MSGARRSAGGPHHLYLSPGMFGFAQLAHYDYFAHVVRALEARFGDAGEALEVHVADVLPTASVRRRAEKLARLVDRSAAGGGPIHLLGHSIGGLDARLVASPGAQLPGAGGERAWLGRLRSVTTMNTPHFGTPLARFFATAHGQRVLWALSAFTFTGLSLGARPLATAGVLIGLLARGDRALGIELRAVDRSVDSLVQLVGDASRPEVRAFLDAIREDQGSMVQLTPEAMDLVAAGFADRPGVAYQSTASMAPAPSPRKWLRTLGHPWQAVSLALFSAVHRITAGLDPRYPCAASPPADGEDDPTGAALAAAFGTSLDLAVANDGVVPLSSQPWGSLVWAGLGDHLDVLGHYRGDPDEEPAAQRHHDWLTSGSGFGPAQFGALMDAIAEGMLEGAGAARAGRRSAQRADATPSTAVS